MSRVLLLSDIHSNWPALQAITEPFDVCVFLGDLVDYGLEPTPCIEWVRKNCKYTVRGNHDHGAAQGVVINGLGGFKYLTGVTRPLTRQLLSEPDRRFLMEMPLTRTATIDDLRYYMVHATPRDPMDEYAPADPEFWARRLEQVEADIVCVGHTHMPFLLEVGNKLVVNPGSVGLPRDGNPRVSYAILEGRKVELKRIDYPVEATINVIKASNLPDPAKDLLIEVYRSGEAKNQRVDPRVVRPQGSHLGVAPRPNRPAGAAPAAPAAPAPAAQQARMRPQGQGVARPQLAPQGAETIPVQDIGAAPEANAARRDARGTQPIPIIPRNPPKPAAENPEPSAGEGQ
jgi:putative phosphoesterase